MLHVDARLRESGLPARLLLQVHDELVLEVDAPAVTEVSRLLCETMEGAWELSVPLVADVKAGQNWEEMTPLPR